MNTSQLITLGATGSSGLSLLSGSLFTEAGTWPEPINPFSAYRDLDCTWRPASNTEQYPTGIFSNLDSAWLAKAKAWDAPMAPPFSLPSPSSASENVSACYRARFFQTGAQIGGATVELAASKGKYGIILLNVIGNIREFGGKTSSLRALFLEKDSNSKWQIKAGVQWTDEAFLNSLKDTQKIQWHDSEKTGTPPNNKREIVWFRKYKYDDLNNTNTAIKFNWNPEADQTKNIYQGLTIKPEVGFITQDFWNGNPKPLETNSSISRPYALFDTKEKKWKRSWSSIDATRIKEWFNLFTADRGSWKKQP